MLNKQALTLLVTIALALFTTAYPSPGHLARRSAAESVITVPTRRQLSLTRADGTFDFDKATVSLAKTYSKHVGNMRNYRNKFGSEAFAEVCFALKFLINA